MAMRYALLNPILEELMKEGRIKLVGDLISLLGRKMQEILVVS